MKQKMSDYCKENNLSYQEVLKMVHNNELKHETTPEGYILILTSEELDKKKCTRCLKEKTLDKFVSDKNLKSGKTSDCKDCRNIRNKDFLAKKLQEDPEFHTKRNLKYKQLRSDYYSKPEKRLKQRNKELIKSFNISLEEYDDMLERQNNLCAICRKPQNSTRNLSFAVDHCHNTGKVRGLLCDWCNRALGLFQDDVNVLKSAIKYLNNNK